MIVNEALTARRRWSRLELHDELPEAFSGPDAMAQVDERLVLVAAVAKLPARQRACIVLRYFEDLPDEQIASLLGCRPSTVRGYAHRALKTLRIDVRPSDAQSDPDRARGVFHADRE